MEEKMKTRLKVILLISHLAVLGAGTGLGIYLLPILTAQENASLNEINDVRKLAKYKGDFRKAAMFFTGQRASFTLPITKSPSKVK